MKNNIHIYVCLYILYIFQIYYYYYYYYYYNKSNVFSNNNNHKVKKKIKLNYINYTINEHSNMYLKLEMSELKGEMRRSFF